MRVFAILLNMIVQNALFLMTFLVDIASQTIDVSAKSRAVGQQTLKPRSDASDYLHHKTYKKHCDECADTYDVPLPCTEKHVTQHHANRHQRHVDRNLHLRKLCVRHPAHRHRNTLTRHCHTAATHLERNARAQQNTTRQLCSRLLQQPHRHKPCGERHPPSIIMPKMKPSNN